MNKRFKGTGNSEMTDAEITEVLTLINSIMVSHNLAGSVIVPDQSGYGLHVATVMCKDCHATFLRSAADFIQNKSTKGNHGLTNDLIK